ncbi:MAG: nickel-responsive transcriptional regulator NikR [Elusimicrobia bacterium]|nr:nickel-responsive transcriptional regulator NikR [Elusimicrobiota bacterium]
MKTKKNKCPKEIKLPSETESPQEAELSRFGVSINTGLLQKFDSLIKAHSYPTRSKAIEDLISNFINEVSTCQGKCPNVVGTINIVYDHNKRELLSRIVSIKQDFQDIVISSHQMHLNHHNCFEMIVIKGAHAKVNLLLDKVKAVKGIKHAALSVFSGKTIYNTNKA